MACHFVQALANIMDEEHNGRADVRKECRAMNRLGELRRARHSRAKGCVTMENPKRLSVHALLVQCSGGARMRSTIDAPRQIESRRGRARVMRALREGKYGRMPPNLLRESGPKRERHLVLFVACCVASFLPGAGRPYPRALIYPLGFLTGLVTVLRDARRRATPRRKKLAELPWRAARSALR